MAGRPAPESKSGRTQKQGRALKGSGGPAPSRQLVLALSMALLLWVGSALAQAWAAATYVQIMPLGDSITRGGETGSYRLPLWQKLVQTDGYRIDFVGSLTNGPSSLPDRHHEGHNGWRIDQINGNIRGWMGTYKPEIILLHIGTNDLRQKTTAATATARLDTLLNTIYTTKPGVKVVVASLVPLREPYGYDAPDYLAYNASIPRLVDKYKGQGRSIAFADMARAGLTKGSPDLPDGVHPSPSGYAKMAAVWYPLAKQALADTPPTAPDPANPTPDPGTGQPDLTVTGVTTNPASPAPGQEVTFSATVKNLGTGPSPAGTVHGVAFRVNGTMAAWSDNSTASIPAGASATLTANGGPDGNATWTAGPAGTYTVQAHVDDINRIPNEANETNNTLDKAISIGGATQPPADPPPTTPPPAAGIPADLSGDGKVSITDLSILLSKWGSTDPAADLNDDGSVGITDLSILLSRWTG